MEKGIILNSMHIFSRPVTEIRDTYAGPMFFYFVFCHAKSQKAHEDISTWLRVGMGKVK